MGIDSKIVQSLFRDHPHVVARTISDSLRVGDLVVDRGFVGVPRVPDDSIGRISKLNGDIAEVEWRDGSSGQVHISVIAHIHEPYEAALHDSAFEIPRFASGTPVLLGNGDRGHILEQVVGPTGFKTYRVQVDASAAPLTIGRRVYATQNAMVKVGSIKPDVVVSFYKEADLQPSATIGAELAVERDEQIIGLQKYAQLPSDLGMLFPYEPPQEVTFHMGRVRFPIDVIFIDRSGRVAAIEEDCQPGYDSYWRHGVVASVLEVNGGWCRQNNVVLRDAVRLVQVVTAQLTAKGHCAECGRPAKYFCAGHKVRAGQDLPLCGHHSHLPANPQLADADYKYFCSKCSWDEKCGMGWSPEDIKLAQGAQTTKQNIFPAKRVQAQLSSSKSGPKVPDNWDGTFPPTFGMMKLRSSSREDEGAPRAYYSSRDYGLIIRWIQADRMSGRWLYKIIKAPNEAEEVFGSRAGYNTLAQAMDAFMRQVGPQHVPLRQRRLVEAQEHFDPASHRTDAVPRVPTQGPPMDPSRFQDHDLPDEVLKDQPLDPANWEQDIGYDQGSDSMRSFEGPGFRPAASKEHK